MKEPKRTIRAAVLASPLTGVLLSGLLFGGPIGLLTGCSVPPPKVRQGLDYGFRTPKQAFESWRTAVQGDLLDEEYRCFSRRWRAENGVSLLTYAAARDELLQKYPQLRWAVYRAEEPEVLALWEKKALLQAKIPGPLWFRDRYLVVEFLREGFWQAYTEANPDRPDWGDEGFDPVDSGLLRYVEKTDSFRIYVDGFRSQTNGTAPEAVIQMDGGWQWKIRRFEILNSPVEEDATGI